MRFHEKTALLHKIHVWSSLIFNELIAAWCIISVKKDLHIAIIIALTLGTEIFWVCNRISLNMLQKSTGKSALVCDYVCVLILSVIIMQYTYNGFSKTGAMLILLAIIIEFLIIFVIIFRYKIRKAFINSKFVFLKKHTKK